MNSDPSKPVTPSQSPPSEDEPPTGTLPVEPRDADDPVLLDITKIERHPQNPRLSLRQEVVDAIAEDLRRTRRFPKHHAILVRLQADGRYQIIQGHHRHAACARVMIMKIWAYVVEMSDEDALRELAFGNSQGELGSLEIGLHALKVVTKAQGKTGMGAKAYATRMGIQDSNLSRYMKGAEVFRAVESALTASDINIGGCRDKALHLAEISLAPESSWSELARDCIENRWSVQKTRARVEEVRERPSAAGDEVAAPVVVPVELGFDQQLAIDPSSETALLRFPARAVTLRWIRDRRGAVTGFRLNRPDDLPENTEPKPPELVATESRPTLDPVKIRARLRKVIAKGVTAKAIAEEAGWTPQHLSLFLRSKKGASEDKLQTLVAALQCHGG